MMEKTKIVSKENFILFIEKFDLLVNEASYSLLETINLLSKDDYNITLQKIMQKAYIDMTVGKELKFKNYINEYERYIPSKYLLMFDFCLSQRLLYGVKIKFDYLIRYLQLDIETQNQDLNFMQNFAYCTAIGMCFKDTLEFLLEITKNEKHIELLTGMIASHSQGGEYIKIELLSQCLPTIPKVYWDIIRNAYIHKIEIGDLFIRVYELIKIELKGI